MTAPRCSRCNAPLVEITVTLAGAEATMRSCSTCDSRTWISDGRPVDLEGVLAELQVEPRRP